MDKNTAPTFVGLDTIVNKPAPDDLQRRLLVTDILQTIDDLKPRHRTAMHLVFIEGYTYARAGQKLGVTGVRVQQIVGKSIRKIKKKLKIPTNA